MADSYSEFFTNYYSIEGTFSSSICPPFEYSEYFAQLDSNLSSFNQAH
jgi:hypothetical protein